MLIHRLRVGIAVAMLCSITASVYAVTPSPLENAYWRFEEGTAGGIVAATDPAATGAAIDSLNANHMRRFGDLNAPTYSAEVPRAKVPGTGADNNLSLWFSGTYMDIYTDGKKINNPIVTAFTLEASFKAEAVGENLWQTVVSKESKSDDMTSDAPPFALKITGDGANVLRLQMRDKGNTERIIDSFTPIVANQWYHAVVVATASEVKLYLSENNAAGFVLQGSAPISGGGPLWEGTVPADGYETVWNIGKGMWARAIADWFRGLIDEVRLTNRALEPAEFLWYPIAMPGDFNADGKVDIEDLVIFESCATGPSIPYATVTTVFGGCPLIPDAEGIIAADFRGDGDVDQVDFGIFQRCYGETPDPDCAN